MPAFLARSLPWLFVVVVAGLAAALALAWGVASAQEDETVEKSNFVRFIEETISTPDRQISLGQIDGALSSDVRISTITIADRKGVWLRLEGAHLIWSRLALLSKRLEIDLLEAQAIRILRRPLPPEGVQTAASASFALPELPVSLRIGKLSVPVVEVTAEIAGEDTTLSVEGAGELADGALDVDLTVNRTKPAGGALVVKADYSDATRQLALELKLQEPRNGFLSNALDLPGRPALAFTIAGTGPLEAFRADVALVADGETLLAGAATIKQGQEGLDFAADLNGALGRLVPPAYSDFFAGQSRLAIAARQTARGGLVLDEARIKSGVLALSMSGAFASDGFPTRLKADGTLGAEDRRPVLLPGSGGPTVEQARIGVIFQDGSWRGELDLSRLATGVMSSERATLRAEGEASDLADASRRSLTVRLTGSASDVAAPDPALARALGKSFDLSGKGRWQAGEPLQVEEIRFANENAQARFLGRLEEATLIGAFSLAAPDLTSLAGLAGIDLKGRAELKATGSVALVGGAFDLSLKGASENLGTGLALDPLIAGRTRLSGRVARTTEGIRFDGLALEADDASARLDGLFGPRASSLGASIEVADAGRLTDRAKGRIGLDLRLAGRTREPDVTADIVAPSLTLQGKPFRDGKAHFEGKLGETGPAGTFTASGLLGSIPVEAEARLTSSADRTWRIEGLSARAAGTTITGDLSFLPDGRAAGRVALAAADIANIAPLFLANASGALNADIVLTTPEARQDAAVNATARGLTLEAVRIGSADIDLSGTDLLRSSALSGRLTAENIVAGDISLARLDATAASSGAGKTAFRAQTSATGASLRAAGIPSLAVVANGTLSGERVSLQATATGARGISLTASGDVFLAGSGLALDLRGRLPLSLADAGLRERAARLTGTAAIDARVTGTLASPAVTGRASVSGATFSDPESGIAITGISGAVRLDGTRAVVERLSGTTSGGGSLGVTGSVEIGGRFLADLALALRNTRVSDGRIVTAQVSGNLTVTGPLLDAPTIGGRIEVARAEITIPERFAANAALLGIKHIAPPPSVRRTLARARLADRSSGASRATGDVILDLVISAPSRIFVRGRGLDAELGGEVALRGPLSNLVPVGSFRLRRGSLDVIGQRITLDAGEVTLVGTLDPLIDLRASVRARSIAVTARVTGQASDPQLVLSSSPELPQDEILAQFLFGRSISDLSPFQVVQLATAVAQLAGGGSGGLLSSIRKSTGLDTLGIITDARGNPALQAGRYVSERIYLGVTTGASGQTNATVNLDITKNLKARVEGGTDGSAAGLFYEREY